MIRASKIVALLAMLTVGSITACASQAPEPRPVEGSAPSAQPVEPDLSRFYDQAIRWTNCGNAECARIEVPIDYAHPDAGTIGLGVSKVKATGDRLGSLLVNPGGPGGSATHYAKFADSIVGEGVREHFDIVGVDPRGVDTSEGIECLTDTQRDELVEVDGTPDDAAEEQRIIEISAQLGRLCAEQEPELFGHVGTVNAARDLDIVRAVLGDRALNYLGKSYGTQLGATYAELFPGRVGRMVLDGVLPAGHSLEDLTREQAIEFDKVLDEFIAYCLSQDDCPLTGTTAEAKEQLLSWIEGLDNGRNPIRVGDRDLTDALASYAILMNLYFPSNDFPRLRSALRDAMVDKDGNQLLDLLDSRINRNPDGTYADNSTDAYYAISCLDRSFEGSVDDVRARAAEWAELSPAFGETLAWGLLACKDWPATGERIESVTAEGSNPILVTSATLDPATPLPWAEQLAAELDIASLITVGKTNHTAYREGNSCLDEAVDDYLVAGTLPRADLACE